MSPAYYGQTASGGTGTVLAKHDHDPSNPGRLASCGKQVSTMRVKIQDDEGGEV